MNGRKPTSEQFSSVSTDPSSPAKTPPRPVWGGPPAEIVTTLDLLRASLLMSLLAAFVAMLGKQWLTRYLRHGGGSMVERCGDRQRKFDGLETWPFHIFIKSLPVMLQIALLLFSSPVACHDTYGRSTPPSHPPSSPSLLSASPSTSGLAAGTSSYECPFQTPASMGLRHLLDSKATKKLLASLFLPEAISLAYTTWVNTGQVLVLASHRVYDTARYIPPSISRITSGIRSMATKIGHQSIILLRIDQSLGNAKQRLVQGTRKFRPAGLLPTTVEDADQQPGAPQNGPGLLVRVWNTDALRKQNTDNVLRQLGSPEHH